MCIVELSHGPGAVMSRPADQRRHHQDACDPVRAERTGIEADEKHRALSDTEALTELNRLSSRLWLMPNLQDGLEEMLTGTQWN